MIDSREALRRARKTQFIFNKSSVSVNGAGNWCSLFRIAVFPAAGPAPTTPAICNSTFAGAMPFTNANAGEESVISVIESTNFSNLANSELAFHDRLVHMGGLNANIITPQTVDLTADLTGSNLVARRGAAAFSDLWWWLEWHLIGGNVATTVTANVTYDDNSTDSIIVSVLASQLLGGTRRLYPNVWGRYIKSVQSVQLSIATGAVSNFGVTATRPLAVCGYGASKTYHDWTEALARVQNDACVQLFAYSIGAGQGGTNIELTLAQG